MDRMIATPYTVFVDESGTPVVRPAENPTEHEGYVVAAVAVGALSVPLVHSMLPRDAAGRMLKSSDPGLTARAVAYFVSELLRSDVEVSLVMLETTSPHNVKLSNELVAASNIRRAARHNPRIKQASLLYMFAATQAIFGVLRRLSLRSGRAAGFIDVVLDQASIPRRERRNLVSAMRQDMARVGFECRSIRWSDEQAEPMLFASDILASIYRRQATQGNAGEPFLAMEAAFRSGRIVIQDGLSTPDPDKLLKHKKGG